MSEVALEDVVIGNMRNIIRKNHQRDERPTYLLKRVVLYICECIYTAV